jgi:hypothetical protein
MGAGPNGSPKDLVAQWFGAAPTAQKAISEHIQGLKGYQDLLNGEIKTGEQQRTWANQMIAASQGPDDLDHAVLAARSHGFTNQDIATYFPVPRNPDGSLATGPGGAPLAVWTPQAKAQAQSALVPAADQARIQQETLQRVAPALANAFNSSPAAYTAALTQFESDHPELKGQFPTDPESRDEILQSGTPANQIETQEARMARIGLQRDIADLRANRAGQPTAYQTQQEYRQDLATKNKADADALKAQGLNTLYSKAAATPAGSKYIDAKGVQRVMPPNEVDTTKDHNDTGTNAVRQQLLSDAETARQQAEEALSRSDELQAKHGWGRFANTPKTSPPAPSTQNPASTAPAARPQSAATPAPPSTPNPPPSTQQPKPPQTWKVGEQTFTENQVVYSGGKPYKITGYNPQTGKLISIPQ